MHKRHVFGICLSLATLALVGCGGEAAEPCKPTKTADGSVVIDCGAGGKATVAPATNGGATLASTAPADAADCPNGGTKFSFGKDADGNGTLDAAEVTQSVNACEGADGAAGANGMDGAAGMNGQNGNPGANGQDGNPGSNGQDGLDGLNSLIDVADEAPGANCADGGQRLSYGLDADGNGALDAAEVTGVRYVCNGAAGLNGVDGADGADGQDGFTTLTNVSAEAAGANCANGGTKLEIGVDADFSGTLSAAEIASVRYLCNGANGAAGAAGRNSLVNVTAEAAGANCATGGQRVQSGIDSNGNNTLDAAEVTSTRYVCNGAAGAAGTSGRGSLINVTAEAAGANCAAGGQKLDYGIDDNSNNTLEAGEIDGTRYVCNGVSGQFYAGRGIIQNLSLAEVEGRGWRRCYTDSYSNSGTPVANILNGCQGTYMMLACRTNGNATLQVAAADLRSTVITDVGTGSASNTPGTGGVSWYFNTSYSWGFFPTGQSLSRTSCDTANTLPEQRMCIHTGGGNINAGWRCGSNTGVSGTHERLILVF